MPERDDLTPLLDASHKGSQQLEREEGNVPVPVQQSAEGDAPVQQGKDGNNQMVENPEEQGAMMRSKRRCNQVQGKASQSVEVVEHHKVE